jgi:hypothetical protein
MVKSLKEPRGSVTRRQKGINTASLNLVPITRWIWQTLDLLRAMFIIVTSQCSKIRMVLFTANMGFRVRNSTAVFSPIKSHVLSISSQVFANAPLTRAASLSMNSCWVSFSAAVPSFQCFAPRFFESVDQIPCGIGGKSFFTDRRTCDASGDALELVALAPYTKWWR